MSLVDPSSRLDRRAAIQWMLTAAAAMALPEPGAHAAAAPIPAVAAKGYGPDPSMVKIYQPGEVWPLILTDAERLAARALCDLIIPADETSPSASAVGVHDFINEWVSSPYPNQAGDRRLLVEGLRWIDSEAQRRFQREFAALAAGEQTAICEDLAKPASAGADYKNMAPFFKRYRDLTAGAYYTTAEGMKAIGYVGNLPSGSFAGPPPEALQHVGLA